MSVCFLLFCSLLVRLFAAAAAARRGLSIIVQFKCILVYFMGLSSTSSFHGPVFDVCSQLSSSEIQ